MERRGRRCCWSKRTSCSGVGEVAGVDQPQRDGPPQRELRGLVDGAGRARSAIRRSIRNGPIEASRLHGGVAYPANSRLPSPTMKKWKIVRPLFGFTHQTSTSPNGSPGYSKVLSSVGIPLGCRPGMNTRSVRRPARRDVQRDAPADLDQLHPQPGLAGLVDFERRALAHAAVGSVRGRGAGEVLGRQHALARDELRPQRHLVVESGALAQVGRAVGAAQGLEPALRGGALGLADADRGARAQLDADLVAGLHRGARLEAVRAGVARGLPLGLRHPDRVARRAGGSRRARAHRRPPHGPADDRPVRRHEELRARKLALDDRAGRRAGRGASPRQSTERSGGPEVAAQRPAAPGATARHRHLVGVGRFVIVERAARPPRPAPPPQRGRATHAATFARRCGAAGGGRGDGREVRSYGPATWGEPRTAQAGTQGVANGSDDGLRASAAGPRAASRGRRP